MRQDQEPSGRLLILPLVENRAVRLRDTKETEATFGAEITTHQIDRDRELAVSGLRRTDIAARHVGLVGHSGGARISWHDTKIPRPRNRCATELRTGRNLCRRSTLCPRC